MTESYERLGGASVSGDSYEVPVPQQAINMELLKLDGEAYWAVREDDGAVLVSYLYDPLEDAEGVRFLASTVVDDERLVQVPDAVFDHWEDVYGGGTAVAGGDRLEFVTTDEMADDEQMLVLPEWQVEDVLGDEA
ncbi:hypothetical protein [Halorussus salinisoli]|uniref:hypothetical protein n=1 Tax=Halorussus salinisoli TaxID=2558242 RepID=UPI0010C2091F|nr:hypothetical protein [Halorussus salinisoli]